MHPIFLSPPPIVDGVFRKPQTRGWALWFVSVTLVVELYGSAWLTLTAVSRPPLSSWAAHVAMEIHAQLRDREETVVEWAEPLIIPAIPRTPPPSPRPNKTEEKSLEPLALAPTPEQAPKETTQPVQAAEVAVTSSSTTNTPSIVNAEGGKVVAGTTSSNGTGTSPADAPSPVQAPSSSGAGKRGVDVRLDEEDWSCPWPSQAESAALDEQEAIIRVLVGVDGLVRDVKVQRDPGLGFGAAAAACARSSRFNPAQDGSGHAQEAWSPPIRVRFVR